MEKIVMDRVPRERHRTPALQLGVRRLLLASAGRHASLGLWGVGGVECQRLGADNLFRVPQPWHFAVTG